MRQLCNVAYATMAEGRNEKELEELDVQIGMVEDPADEAKDALRKHQDAMGMMFDDPDAPVSPSAEGLGDLPDEYLK